MRLRIIGLALLSFSCAHSQAFTQAKLAIPVDSEAAPGERIPAAEAPELTRALGHTLARGGTALEPTQVAIPRLLRIKSLDVKGALIEGDIDMSSLLRGKSIWCQDGNSIAIDSATKVAAETRLVASADVVQWDYTGAPIRYFCTGDGPPHPPGADYVAVGLAKVETTYKVDTLMKPAAAQASCRIDNTTGFRVQVAEREVTAVHSGWSEVRVQSKDLFCADAQLWLRSHCPEEPSDKACLPDWFGLVPIY